MSSRVRKGQTSFAPKIKNVVRRKQQQPTPSSTQIESSPDKTSSSTPLTPEASQRRPSQVKFFTGDKSGDKNNDDEVHIDPKDSSQKNDMAIEDDDDDDEDDEYGDNDIFKRPAEMMHRKSSSSLSQRRLSGITSLNRPPSRKGSVSFSIRPRGSISEASPNAIPIPLEIPLGKKRRKLSIKKPLKRVSIGGIITESDHQRKDWVSEGRTAIILPGSHATVESESDKGNEEQVVDGTNNDGTATVEEGTSEPQGNETNQSVPNESTVIAKPKPTPIIHELSRDELYAKGVYLVYALNKDGDKLVKYRTGPLPGPDGEAEDNRITLAEETVNLRITDRSQLPRGVGTEPAELLSHVKIDPGFMTMKDLSYNDFSVGEVSENYIQAMEAKERQIQTKIRNKEIRKIARSENITLENAEIEYERRIKEQQSKDQGFKQDNDSDIDDNVDEAEKAKLKQLVEQQKKEKEAKEKEAQKKNEMEKLKRNAGGNNIQLEIGASGKFEVNVESTIVSQHSNAYERIVEETNPFERPILSTTYSNRKHSDRWTNEEEEKFYRALSTWGTDFTIIGNLFPYRNRKQIKAKFNSEERKRPELIEMALSRKLEANLDLYYEVSRKAKFDMNEFNEEIKQIRNRHEVQKKELLKSKEQAEKEDSERNRLKEIERKSGKQPLERLSRHKTLRTNEEVVGTIDSKDRDFTKH